MGIWKDKFGYVAEENELLRAEIARLNAAFTNQHHSTWKDAYMNLSKVNWDLKMEIQKMNEKYAEHLKAAEMVSQELDVFRANNHLLLSSYDNMRCRLGLKDTVIDRLRLLLEVKTKEIYFLREKYKESTQNKREANDGTD